MKVLTSWQLMSYLLEAGGFFGVRWLPEVVRMSWGVKTTQEILIAVGTEQKLEGEKWGKGEWESRRGDGSQQDGGRNRGLPGMQWAVNKIPGWGSGKWVEGQTYRIGMPNTLSQVVWLLWCKLYWIFAKAYHPLESAFGEIMEKGSVPSWDQDGGTQGQQVMNKFMGNQRWPWQCNPPGDSQTLWGGFWISTRGTMGVWANVIYPKWVVTPADI